MGFVELLATIFGNDGQQPQSTAIGAIARLQIHLAVVR